MTSKAQDALAFATRQIGKPYVWGAQGPNAYDCSGLVLASYAHAGISLPDTTADNLRNYCTPVKFRDLRAGDIIQPHAGHVFLWAGDGNVVEAPRKGLNVRRVKRWGGLYYIGRIKGSQDVGSDDTPDRPLVQNGSTGDAVRTVQGRLNARGAALTVDGKFGHKTERAVRLFQQQHHLRIDGVVGPVTWGALGG